MRIDFKISAVFLLVNALNLFSQQGLIGHWTFENRDNLVEATVGSDLTLVGSHAAVAGPDTGNSAVNIGVGSYYICQHNISANGGGNKINEFTIVMDIKFNQPRVWYTLYQTDVFNMTDGEWFVDRSGKMGVHATGYSDPVIESDKWYRLAIAVKNGSRYDYYVNGELVLHGQPGAIDGRFALESSVLFFADENQEDNPVDIAELRMYSRALSDDDIAELGGFDQSGNDKPRDPVLIIHQGADQELIAVLVDPETHQDYGLAYPVTYKIDIPANSYDLTAEKRYSTAQAWSTLTEKNKGDFFNGIEAVRFDYAAGIAYVSVAFSSKTDSLFIKIMNNAGINVPVSFHDICQYYDNRRAAVTSSADDWADSGDKTWYQADEAFQITCRQFRKNRLWLSCGIITQYCHDSTWQHIQTQLDSGYVEACSHSRTHSYGPYEDPVSEIAGSKQDIFDNLDLPDSFKNGDREYVYVWLAPAHYYDEIVNTLVGVEKYLVNRLYNWPFDQFSEWNPDAGYYYPIGMSREVSPIWEGTTDLSDLNSYFDSVVAKHGIYHVMTHPYFLLEDGFQAAQYAWDHLSYISRKPDIWYVSLGHLYLYHYLQENWAVETYVKKTDVHRIKECRLRQNYPNPFNPATTIEYELSAPAHVELQIYNELGQLVRSLKSSRHFAGSFRITWDGRDDCNLLVAAGLYFCRIKTEHFSEMIKLMLMK